MTRALLEVKGLEVVYNRAALAVQGVSLSVQPGQLVALLGTNGAGKTTTLRAISGFLGSDNAEISAGTVEYDGELLNGKLPYHIVRRGVVLVPEREKIFQTLTVDDNLSACVAAQASGTAARRAALDKVFTYFPVLHDRRR